MSDISSVSSNMLRITGLATGMDTDSMVKKMMAAENLKLDKLKQDRQYVQWRQDSLRDFIKDFRDLRQNYLLIDSPADTNMIKSGAYSGSSVAVTDTSNTASTAITATALPGAVNGTSTVVVNKIAKGAKNDGASFNSVSFDSSTFNAADWIGKISFQVKDNNGNATTQIIDLSNINSDGNLTSSNLAQRINEQINANDGLKGKIAVAVSSDKVSFNVISSDSIKIQQGPDTTVSEVSTLANKELNTSTSTKLSDLGIDNAITFTIKQGTNVSSKITIDKDKTIQDLINEIYNAQARNGDNTKTLYSDLQVSYSDLTKSLAIQTRNTGSSQSLQIVPEAGSEGNFEKLGLSTGEKSGQDAEISITPPGSSTATTITKSTNSFTIDNMTYNLAKDPGTTPYTVNLTIKQDSQESVKKIKAFVAKYNELVKKVTDKISEKKNYNYKPLTDDQKSEMKEEQIKAWEDKAKQGILKNDGDLQNILYGMRTAFMNEVESAGISLKEIGIDTYGEDEAITKPGQLKVDETKLKTALETRGDQVMRMFTASPDSSITDTKEKYNNTGIFKRIEDIIDKAAVTTDGNLLKKAGYVGTASETTNTITKQLKDQDTAIYEMNRKLADKEERYYQMFAKLETAMNNMNAQQSWLAQQLGTK